MLETAQTGTASQIWEAPVVLAPTGTDPNATLDKTGYEYDLADALHCADGTPNNANVTALLTGGGGSSTTSPLGSSANGLIFEYGQP